MGRFPTRMLTSIPVPVISCAGRAGGYFVLMSLQEREEKKTIDGTRGSLSVHPSARHLLRLTDVESQGFSEASILCRKTKHASALLCHGVLRTCLYGAIVSIASGLVRAQTGYCTHIGGSIIPLQRTERTQSCGSCQRKDPILSIRARQRKRLQKYARSEWGGYLYLSVWRL